MWKETQELAQLQVAPHSPTPGAACDEEKGRNQLCQSWGFGVAGTCNDHLLCMVSCDLS